MNLRGGALSPNQPNYPIFPSGVQGGTSFAFRKRWGQIDWRRLASVDVDRIAKEVDFQALQQNIMNITFCNIETEEFQHVDQNFIKIFKLSQLVIEYLLHSQQYLSNRSTSLEQSFLQAQQELDKAKNDMKTRDEELKAIKKENRKRRKVIEAYQDMINAGATGLHACPVCKREFVSSEYLQSHIQRRHPSYLPKKETRDEPKQPSVTQEDLEAKLMEQMTQRLLTSEKQLREEMRQQEQETLNIQVKEFDTWKREEKQRMTIEIEEFKRPIITELEELRQEKEELEKTLQDKEAELLNSQNKRQSHLGHLEGARELYLDGTNKLNESKAEIKQLKETFETQMLEMQTSLKEQDKSWQKRMQKLSGSYRDQLRGSVAKLETLEQTVLEGSRIDEQNKVSKKLKSLQQKLQQQEEALLSQQGQLTTLQSREPSPILPCQEKDEVQSDELSSELDSDGDDYTDYNGRKYFTPMTHRPMIKTKHAHKQEDIEKIRRQTQAVFSDMLVQKGLQRDSNGLKTRDFEEKMGVLQQERHHKMRTHYHFAEHRQRLAHEIEEIAAKNYKPATPQSLQIPSPKHKQTAGSKTTKMVGKPPKPTPKMSPSLTRSATPQIERDNLKADVDTSRNIPGPMDRSIESDVSITTSNSEDIDNSERSNPLSIQLRQHTTVSDRPLSENTPTVIVTEVVVSKSTPQDGTVKMVQEKPAEKGSRVNNSWDSDDSIEELDLQNNGRASSTPIKSVNAAKVDRHVDSISVDSFDLSSSDLLPTSQPTKVGPPTVKFQSRTVTSQSALTSVSAGDFGSDSYDLDISDLT